MLKRVTLLSLMSLSLVFAKTYTFSLSSPANAGAVQLKPGEYRIEVEGSSVVLKDDEGHQIDANASLETVDQKYDQTSVVTSTADGANRLEYIELGGTKDKIEFK
jgi:hypothetical protein